MTDEKKEITIKQNTPPYYLKMELVSKEEYEKCKNDFKSTPPLFIQLSNNPREANQIYRNIFTKLYSIVKG